MWLKSEQCHTSENYVHHLQVQPNKNIPMNTPPYTFFLIAVSNGDDPKQSWKPHVKDGIRLLSLIPGVTVWRRLLKHISTVKRAI